MKILVRIATLIALIIFGEFLFSLFVNVADPMARVQLSVEAVNGSMGDAGKARIYNEFSFIMRCSLIAVYSAVFWILLISPVFQSLNKHEK